MPRLVKKLNGGSVNRFVWMVLLGFLLAGCSGVEWFPDADSSDDDGTSGITVTAFSFTPKTNASAGQTQTSDTITVAISGGSAAPITIVGGEYRINDEPFTSVAGTVTNGARVTVRHAAAATAGQSVVSTLTIGDKSATFTSTTGTAEVTAFSFPARTNVTAGEQLTSAPVILTINGGSAPIRITAGTYQKNTGAFTNAAGTVVNGDQITLRHIHPPGVLQAVTTVTVGDKSATFTSTTIGTTSSVPAFSFAAKANVAGGSTQTSETITVTLAASEPITVQGEAAQTGEYRINDGAFTSAPGTVNSGDQVTVRHIAAASGQTVTTLTIGDRSATFTSTTVPATVAAFAFSPASVTSFAVGATPASNPITVALTNGTSAPISVSGGTYSINNGAFTATTGTVSNGNTVTVQAPAGVAGQTSTITLTIGDKSATFSHNTVTVSAFTFPALTNVARNQQQTSSPAPVTLVGGPAPIRVVGGLYSVNGGAYTSAAGTVKTGDTVTVRHTSASTAAGTVTTTLTIGETSADFKSTTSAT